MKQRSTAYAPEPSTEQSELIDALGGPADVARILTRRTGRTVSRQSVGMWKNRGIPFRFRAPLAIEARERNIGVPENFLGEQPPPPPPAVEDQVPFL